MVGDEEIAIVHALNSLRHRYTYVFTTGGIGPTHGDITADCVARAFGVPIDRDPRALAILHEWVKTTGAEMNEARLRMTRIPKGADLILNKVSLDVEIEHVNAGPKRTRDPGGTLYQGGGKRKAGVLRASQVFWRPVREMHNVMNLSERPARRAR